MAFVFRTKFVVGSIKKRAVPGNFDGQNISLRNIPDLYAYPLFPGHIWEVE